MDPKSQGDGVKGVNGIHALSIVAKDLKQFEANGNSFEAKPSPSCMGGDGSLPSKNS
jgi:hypothetical protein